MREENSRLQVRVVYFRRSSFQFQLSLQQIGVKVCDKGLFTTDPESLHGGYFVNKGEVMRAIGETVHNGKEVLCFASFMPECGESTCADIVDFTPFLNSAAKEALSNVTAFERWAVLLQWYAMHYQGALSYVHSYGSGKTSPNNDLVIFTSAKQARKALKSAGKASLSATSKASALSQPDGHEPLSSASSNGFQHGALDPAVFVGDRGSTWSTEVRSNDSDSPYPLEYVDGSAAGEPFYVCARDDEATAKEMIMAHVSHESNGEVLDYTVGAYRATIYRCM